MTFFSRSPCDEDSIRAGADCAGCTRATGRWVLAATILGSSMAFIDGTVVNVALPVLQVYFGATVIELQWIVESYALFLAALILTGGVMGDLFGRRRVFMIGVALFAAASLWCAEAADATELIIARAVQGIGAAALVPGSLALISATFSREQRGRAIGTWSAFTALTMALGPVLGGWLVDNVSWRWVFYINLPLAAAVLAIAASRVPESRSETAQGLDPWGMGLVTLGLGALVFGLIESGHRGFADPLVWGALAVGAASLVAFVAVETKVRAPMLPLGLFRSGDFSGANLITLLLYAALGGALFFVPFELMQVRGYSATAAGASFLPLIAVMVVMSRWAGGLVDRYGGRAPLMAGPVLASAGYALFAFPLGGGGYWSDIFPAMVVLGLGMAVSVAPLTTVVMGAIDERRAGTASGVNNAVSRVAGLLALAVFGIVMLAAFNEGLDARLAGLEIDAGVRAVLDGERIKLAGAALPAGLGDELAAALRQAINDSFRAGYRQIMLIGAGLALLAAASAALTLKRPA